MILPARGPGRQVRRLLVGLAALLLSGLPATAQIAPQDRTGPGGLPPVGPADPPAADADAGNGAGGGGGVPDGVALDAPALNLPPARTDRGDGPPYRPGVNLIQVPDIPFTDPDFAESLAALAATGAGSVALIPFMWQPDAASTEVGFGSALTDAELEAAILAAHAAGLAVFLKPHVWIDGSWAGAIDPGSLAGWERWVTRYLDPILHYAALAERLGVARFAVGTELVNLRDRRLWQRIVGEVRAVYSGEVTYVAQGIDAMMGFPAWDLMDVAALSLYEPLPLTDDTDRLDRAVAAALDRLETAQQSLGLPLVVAELGLMSARDAQVEPWLSPEQRPAAEPDQAVQAAMLSRWLRALETRATAGRLLLDGVYIWRWFSDPDAGGGGDIDFTVQNKLAAGVLACHWRGPACPGF